MSQTDILLPCPFCGSTKLKVLEGQIIGNRPLGPNRMIRCEDCHVTGPWTPLEDAVKHWNMRTDLTSKEILTAFKELKVSERAELLWELEDHVPR